MSAAIQTLDYLYDRWPQPMTINFSAYLARDPRIDRHDDSGGCMVRPERSAYHGLPLGDLRDVVIVQSRGFADYALESKVD